MAVHTSDIEFGVLRANGWKVGQPRKDGSIRATASAYAMAAGASVDFELVAPADGDWTFRFGRADGKGEPYSKAGGRADIASDAVAFHYSITTKY